MVTAAAPLTRIGVFYDGNFFAHVSRYYRYIHERRASLSISGLHNFIRHEVAKVVDTDTRHCQIVDAHYFRGRLRAKDAEDKNKLYQDRVFDDVLMRHGITTHFLPLGNRGEKGIDVWFALEAFELATYKRFSVVVLIACDGDYVPLVRKLNTLGARVMLLGWDFKYIDQYSGDERETRTSQALIEEVTYPIQMNQVIDDRARRKEPIVNALFYRPRPRPTQQEIPEASPDTEEDDVAPEQIESLGESESRFSGRIKIVKEGFGFIYPNDGGKDLFFSWADVTNCDFNDLSAGEQVTYTLGTNAKGACAKQVRRVAD